jgi:oligopeptide/dipeptide ABC transporter ATP-binding protein
MCSIQEAQGSMVDRNVTPGQRSSDEVVLAVENLTTQFSLKAGTLVAVDDVSFSVKAGRVLCIVGESGSGKSVMARSIMRLIDPPGRITAGRVNFRNHDLLELDEREMEAIRGDRLSMVFQNPMTSLNPAFSVGEQVAEGIVLHQKMSRAHARTRAADLLDMVGIPDARRRFDDYPHQFSGGMRQRILIAAAIACSPDVLIADEPTTALDVTIQAQILKLLKRLQDELHNALILITHDLGVVAVIADDVAVMYAGRIVEQAPVATIFSAPRHPYTKGLIAAMRSIESVGQPLAAIRGLPLMPINRPAGCSFALRCYRRIDRCTVTDPAVEVIAPGHAVACLRAREDEGVPA